MTFDTPEGPERHLTSGVWNFRPPEDIAKAIAQDLQNLGLFKEAFFGFRPSDGDLILRSQLHSTRYVWSGGLTELDGSVVWLYVLDADFHYDSLLKRGLRRAFADLQTRLAERVEAEEKLTRAK